MNKRMAPIVNMHVVPRRGLSREEAANALNLALPLFDAMVLQGRIAGGIDLRDTWIWDVRALALREGPLEDAAKIGMIYVIGFSDYIKIGWSSDVFYRIKTLQDGVPEYLMIHACFIGSMEKEKELHKRFALHRLRGEWFRKNSVIKEWIECGCPI